MIAGASHPREICTFRTYESGSIIQVYSIVGNALFVFAIPFLVILISNIIFIRLLHARKKLKLGQIPATVAQNDPRRQRLEEKIRNERTYVIIMMLLTCSFAVLTLGAASANYFANRVTTTDHQNLVVLLRIMSPVLLTFNSSMNIFFYLLGGRMYRDACMKSLKKLRIKISPYTEKNHR